MERSFSFGSWVRRQRKAIDLTQAELGRQVGCAVVTIQKIEADDRRPSRQLAARLAEFLQVPPAERAAFLSAARAAEPFEPPTVTTPSATTSTSIEPAVEPALPVAPSPLIGREHELATLCDLLARPDTRLLTLTGAGGSGKTRLALALATELVAHPADRFADGVWWVDLAPLREPGMVLPAIAHVLGIPQTSIIPLRDLLLRRLREQRLLLVLDNCEHLVDTVAELAGDILAAAPDIRLLITSRALLHLQAETIFDVPPLAIPPSLRGAEDWVWRWGEPTVERDSGAHAESQSTQSRMMQYESVELFLKRAQAVSPGFALNAANVAAIVEICRLVDGLPLAIELAAVHMRTLPPAALLTQLQAHGALALAGTARDLPARQRTIRSAIQWSYDLLPANAQQVFRRLGIFAGGWYLAAAAAVALASDLPTAEPDLASHDESHHLAILEALELLLDHSLIVRQPDIEGESRFTMLEPVREFALDCLSANGEEAATRWRHAHFFVDWNMRLEDHWFSRSQLHILTQQEAELDNCRAALSWLLSKDDLGDQTTSPNTPCRPEYPATTLALRMARDLYGLLRFKGHMHESLTWLERALAQCSNPTPALLRRAHLAAAYLATFLGDVAASRAHGKACLAAARLMGDIVEIAWAMTGLGAAEVIAGEYARADDWHDQALVLARQVSDNLGLLRVALAQHAWSSGFSGKHTLAIACADESVSVARTIGAPELLGESLLNLGFACLMTGNSQHAMPALLDANQQFEIVQDRRQMSATLDYLGVLARWQGDFVATIAFLDRAMAHGKILGALWSSSANELEFALLALDQGNLPHALTCAAAGLAQWRDTADLHGIATAAGVQALILLAAGDLDAAEQAMADGLTPLREIGEPPRLPAQYERHAWFLPRALGVAGLLAAYRGDYPTGIALLEQALTDERQPHFVGEETRLRANLGRVWLWAGDRARAADLLQQAWEACRRMGARPLAARVLEDLAALAFQQGDTERAARMLGAADALREALGMARWPVDQPAYDGLVAATRMALGGAGYAATYAAGHGCDWREAAVV